MFRWLLAATCFCCAASASGEIKHQTKTVESKPGLIEIRADIDGAEAPDVTWRAEYRISVTTPDGRVVEARDPTVVDFRVYENGRIFICYASSGQTLFVTSHKIYYGQKLQVITDFRINVTGKPAPTPPPDPQPVNPPPQPVPDNVSNEYGIGKMIYTEARAINDRAFAQQLADSTASIFWRLHRGQCTGQEADRELRDLLNSVPPAWSSLAGKITAGYSAALGQHGTGIVATKSVIREISYALAEAAK
jgi:hypothetical protein